MTNLDMKKTLKHLYNPSAKAVSVVDVPPVTYLMIDGKGNPNTAQRYQDAIPALYKIAYGIRAIFKAKGEVFTVMPLEGLWEFEGQEEHDMTPLTEIQKDKFIWTLMILQPEGVTQNIFEQARDNARGKDAPVLLDDVRLETYHEGEAVQIMHIGAYEDETDNIVKLHNHISDNGWTISGKHHEIYLSDPRKVAAEKLKTVIRQPFTR